MKECTRRAAKVAANNFELARADWHQLVKILCVLELRKLKPITGRHYYKKKPVPFGQSNDNAKGTANEEKCRVTPHIA